LTKHPKIRFTRHAREKLELMRRYGFDVDEEKIVEAIQNPTLSEQKNAQYFITRTIDTKYALRVVYEKRKGYLVVITFYPVRRQRYGV